ncbi:MAG: hypothetical protein A3G93_05040 [Nitrospinae bacterium RIFCSPLOWO2_12_FULL_45_22]|nr:MAG: hypothetical protein A3G93_05040 [Nitrospinae bacterium RIFCSPLOWO2_12_FULL_45_22]
MRTKREAPYSSLENMKIERDLFGWKLYYTRVGRKKRRFLECRSREEARYLRVFFDAEMPEVYVPKDDEYLRSILPELERLKTRMDEIINSYLETVLNRKIRERVRSEVFMELTK